MVHIPIIIPYIGYPLDVHRTMPRRTQTVAQKLRSITLEKLREIRSLGGTAFSENFENYSKESSGWKTEAANNTIWHVVGRKSKDGKNAMWCGVKGGNQYSDKTHART